MTIPKKLSYLPTFLHASKAATVASALTALLAVGCAAEQKSTRLLRVSGDLEGCANIVELCLQTEPPQCFETCADDPGDCDDPVPLPPDNQPPGDGEVEPNGGPTNGLPPANDGPTNGLPPDNDGPISNSLQRGSCDNDPCVIGTAEDGTPVAICYPEGCVISSDNEVSCEPGTPGEGNEGGSEGDGSAGDNQPR